MDFNRKKRFIFCGNFKCGKSLLYLCFFVLFTSCLKNDERFKGTWKDDLGKGQIVFEKNDVHYFGKKGTYTTKKRSNFDFSGRDDGTLTLELPGQKIDAGYIFTQNDQFLILQYKKSGTNFYLTRKGSPHYKEASIPSGWKDETQGTDRYPMAINFFSTTHKEFMVREYRVQEGNMTMHVRKVYARDKGGSWSHFQTPEGRHPTEQEDFFVNGDIIVVSKNAQRTYLSIDEGDHLFKISDNFPSLPDHGPDYLSGARIKFLIIEESLFAFRFENNALKVFKMSRFKDNSRSTWKLMNTVSTTQWSEPTVVAVGDNIYLRFLNLYRSQDHGANWEKISDGLPEKDLWGQLSVFDNAPLYFDYSLEKVFVFNEKTKKWEVKDSGRIQILATHQSGLYGMKNGQLFKLTSFGGEKENIGGQLKHPTLKFGKLFMGDQKIYHGLKAFIGISLP